jgi:hypothetical protein
MCTVATIRTILASLSDLGDDVASVQVCFSSSLASVSLPGSIRPIQYHNPFGPGCAWLHGAGCWWRCRCVLERDATHTRMVTQGWLHAGNRCVSEYRPYVRLWHGEYPRTGPSTERHNIG